MNSVSTHLDNRVASAFYGRFSSLHRSQESTILPLLAGKNLVLSSGTGSGKTEAVMAPLVIRLWEQAVRADELAILYIAPTKALVNDVEKRLSRPLDILGVRLGVRHGDRDDLTRGIRPHVLVTTPESLDVMLFRHEPVLKTARAVVIDEVHLLYNSQRGLQLSILLQRLKSETANPFQTVMLSATIGCLTDVTAFVLGSTAEAEHLSFPSDRIIDAQIRHIAHVAEFLALVHKLLGKTATKLLVFANSRRECERLAGVLAHDASIAPALCTHYSSLSAELRQETEQRFASSRTAICIATSTLELGIDIGDIDAVILWGVPSGIESFLQRIGRGNRRSRKANVVCLIPDNAEEIILDALRFLVLIEASRKGELPVRRPYELYGAVAQQVLDLIAAEGGRFTRIADICGLLSHKDYLRRPVVEEILDELATNGFLQRHGFKNRYGSDEGLHSLVDHKLIYGNFAMGSQTVDVYHGAKRLGEVPATNLLRVRRGQAVRFAGKHWRVVKASRERISLGPARGARDAIDFTYPGKGVGWDSFLSNRIWQLIHGEPFPAGFLEKNLREKVLRFIQDRRRLWTPESVPLERTENGFRYLTFAGYFVNKAVALVTNQDHFRATDLSLIVGLPIRWDKIPTAPGDFEHLFHSLFEANSSQSLYQSLLPMKLQMVEFLQEWLRDDSVPVILQRLRNSRTHVTS